MYKSRSQRNMFAPKISANHCNICMLQPDIMGVRDERLLICNNCKLIGYCSVDHQKLDWPIHKAFCNSVQKVLETKNIKHPLDFNGPVKTKADLEKTLMHLKCLLQVILKRRLEAQEEELTNFPRVCEHCYKFGVKHHLRCLTCNAVNYCSEEHKALKAKDHEKVCEDLKLCYMGYFDNQSFNPSFITFTQPLDVSKQTSVLTAIESTSSARFEFPPTNGEDYRKVAIGGQFSYVLTIRSMLERVCGELPNKVLVLYIVGSSDDHCFFTQDHLRCLLFNLPGVDYVRIYFIGPEAQGLDSAKSISCGGQQREVETFLHAMPFEEFSKTMMGEGEENQVERKNTPTMIVAFNCGFSEFFDSDDNPWVKGLQEMLQYVSVPIVFTSYTRSEALADRAVINKVAADLPESTILVDTMAKIEKNVFRDTMPIRNWEITDVEDPIFYRNGYVQAVMSRRNIL